MKTHIINVDPQTNALELTLANGAKVFSFDNTRIQIIEKVGFIECKFVNNKGKVIDALFSKPSNGTLEFSINKYGLKVESSDINHKGFELGVEVAIGNSAKKTSVKTVFYCNPEGKNLFRITSSGETKKDKKVFKQVA